VKKTSPFTTLFLDVGGVLLTNGWDRHSRALAVKTFHLDQEEMESRHRLVFDTFEIGKITLETYLDRVIFYQKRAFSRSRFKEFIFEQSKPFLQMIELMAKLKAAYGLKVAFLNNEGRELNEYRIKKFKLDSLADFHICSCIVHLKKPDEEIYRLALDIAQTPAEKALYVENTPMYVDIANGLGMQSILHTDQESTHKQLTRLLDK